MSALNVAYWAAAALAVYGIAVHIHRNWGHR